MKIKKKIILLISFWLFTLTLPTQTSLITKVRKIFNITKKTTQASSYTAAGSALTVNSAAMLYALFYVIKNRNEAKIKMTKTALQYFTNTPKTLCTNLVPATIFVLSTSAVGSLYTAFKMFKNAYQTLRS